MVRGRHDVSDLEYHQLLQKSQSRAMPVMRIAVAGTGGLGCLIAHYLTEDTSHQVVLLSRTVRPNSI